LKNIKETITKEGIEESKLEKMTKGLYLTFWGTKNYNRLIVDLVRQVYRVRSNNLFQETDIETTKKSSIKVLRCNIKYLNIYKSSIQNMLTIFE